MHRFVFPTVDVYIDNHPDNRNKNFGRDEILEISSEVFSIRNFVETSSIQTIGAYGSGIELIGFLGKVTGSISGGGYVSGSLVGCNLVIPDVDNC